MTDSGHIESILVAFATKRGSTREVAEAVAATLHEQGFLPSVHPAAAVRDLGPYEAVVVGGALYTGRWHADAVGLLRRCRNELASLPFAAFALGPRTLDPEDVARSETQLARGLGKTPELRPIATRVFGGVVNPDRLSFPFNRMPASDARDWSEIEAWARELALTFGYGKSAAEPRDPRSRLQRSHR